VEVVGSIPIRSTTDFTIDGKPALRRLFRGRLPSSAEEKCRHPGWGKYGAIRSTSWRMASDQVHAARNHAQHAGAPQTEAVLGLTTLALLGDTSLLPIKREAGCTVHHLHLHPMACKATLYT